MRKERKKNFLIFRVKIKVKGKEFLKNKIFVCICARVCMCLYIESIIIRNYESKINKKK